MAKEFIYLSSQYDMKHTTEQGNIYRMFKGRPYLVKNEKDIIYFENHVNFESVDGSTSPAKEPELNKKFTKLELEGFSRGELIKVLNNYNVNRIPRLTNHKIEKILELQGGENMEEDTKSTESTETPEAPAESTEEKTEDKPEVTA